MLQQWGIVHDNGEYTMFHMRLFVSHIYHFFNMHYIKNKLVFVEYKKYFSLQL